MTNIWTNERVIDFINEVESHPQLWNVEIGEYKDRSAKKDWWAVVGEKFGISSDEAYKKFRSLRTYAKNEEKKRLKSGSSGSKQTKWFAYDAISFILNQDTPNTGRERDSENDSVNMTATTENLDITADKEEVEDLGTTDSLHSSAHSPKPRASKKKSKPEDPPLEKAQHITRDVEKRRIDYSAFGEHIANKLSRYDAYTSSLAEFKIMQVLFDCDMGIHRNQASSTYTPRSDNDSEVAMFAVKAELQIE